MVMSVQARHPYTTDYEYRSSAGYNVRAYYRYSVSTWMCLPAPWVASHALRVGTLPVKSGSSAATLLLIYKGCDYLCHGGCFLLGRYVAGPSFLVGPLYLVP